MLRGRPTPRLYGSASDAREQLDAVSVRGLTKNYGDRAVVGDLRFGVPLGAVCGFIGPNGAGKTTTIRMLLGLIRPTAGTATVLGHSIDEPAAYLHRVGAMIEGPAFYPALSGRRNLEVLASLAGIDRARVDVVLELVRMTGAARDPFRSYSLGMKQRIGIAAALLSNPELLILDAPTNGLDPEGIREVRELLQTLTRAGATVFVSSHLLDELQHVCDHVVIISHGALVFDGSIDALASSRRPELTAVPERSEDLFRLAALAQRAGHLATIDDGFVRIAAPATWAGELNRAAMNESITLVAFAAIEPRLEDIFFELTTGGQL